MTPPISTTMPPVTSPAMELMREKLSQLLPLELDITDESHLHAGHAGAQQGGGHFHLHIISPAFVGMNTVQRHRLIYDALHGLIPHTIHALSIDAQAPASITTP